MADNKNPNWGGARVGSGRKSLGRKQVNFRCTDAEADILKGILKQMRDTVNQVDWLALSGVAERKVKTIEKEITVFIDNATTGDINKSESYFFIIGTNGSVRKLQQQEPGAQFEILADDKKWYSCEIKRSTDGKYFFAPTGVVQSQYILKNDAIYHVRNVKLWNDFSCSYEFLKGDAKNEK